MADASRADRTTDSPLTADMLTVTELNERIVAVVNETSALNSVRCTGEITDRHQNRRVLYFTLTDGDAERPCLIWANRYRKHEHEQKLAEAVEEATAPEGSPTVYYKAAIAVILLLMLLITALWLGII